MQRLTSAAESTGATYGYSYDLAGNRTGSTLNGATATSFGFNAASTVRPPG